MNRLGPALIIVVAATACGTRPSTAARRADVQAAMDHYLRLTKLVNADSVAGMYTADGEMLQARMAPIRGREAIRAFLRPFDGRTVVDTVVGTTDALEVYDSTAYLWGGYHQVTRLDGPPSTYDGRLVMLWRLEPDGAWRIARILVQPAP